MKSRQTVALPSPAMIVALMALFVALGGISYAAGLKKNSVGTKQLKNNAVTSAKIKRGAVRGSDVRSDSLNGAQINESTLAKVPDADAIDGVDGSTLAMKDQLLIWNVAMNRGDAPRVLATVGSFTFTAKCDVNGANTNAAVVVTTSANDRFAGGDSDFDTGDSYTPIDYINFAAGARHYVASEIAMLDPVTGESILDQDGETIGIWGGFPGVDCRFVANIPIARP